MRKNLAALFGNIRTWTNNDRTKSVTLIVRRTRVSDCFSQVYKWKNSRNRPSPDEANTKNEIQEANLTLQTVYHLELLSLVDFSNEAAIVRLSSAIRFAERLKDVDTAGVEPLFSLLENENLLLREDEVTESNQKSDVLRNASLTFEDFYVAPPGNIPLEQEKIYIGQEGDDKMAAAVVESSVDLKKARGKTKK